MPADASLGQLDLFNYPTFTRDGEYGAIGVGNLHAECNGNWLTVKLDNEVPTHEAIGAEDAFSRDILEKHRYELATFENWLEVGRVVHAALDGSHGDR